MAVLSEPKPIMPGDPNAAFQYNAQLQALFQSARNITLTQRGGTIANNDKTGNVNGKYVVFTSNGVANTEDTVAHKLGRTPVGYIPVKQDKSAVLYDSGTAFTSTNVYWKSSAATVAWTVFLF